MEKILNVRHQLRNDILANWTEKNPVLLAGELAIVRLDDGSVNLKIGDGSKAFNDLPYLSSLSSDVKEWAKSATKPTYSVDEIEGLEEAIAASAVTTDGVLAALGFDGAENGAQPVKGADGSLKWIVPDATTVEGLNTSVETLKTDVKDVQDALDILKGTEEGSVSYQIAQVVAGADKDYDTLKEIADWIKSDTTGAAKMTNDLAALKALVGEKSVSEQIAENAYNLPAATAEALGGVKVDNDTITANVDGVIAVNKVGVSKLYVEEGNELILDGGNA